MDILAHGLYGGLIVIKAKPSYYWLGVLSGMAPDLLAGGYAISKEGIRKGIHKFASEDSELPESVYKVYYLSHSFITAFVLFFILYILHRDLAILALPYAFHILCDIPFHKSRFCTRFLYPFSNFHIKGFSYSDHKWLYIPNYIILIISYYLILK